MSDQDQPNSALQERAAELACLYEIESLLQDPAGSLHETVRNVVRALPRAWAGRESCRARIVVPHLSFQAPDFQESSVVYATAIVAQGKSVGAVEVSCVRPAQQGGPGVPFPVEKQRLIDAVAQRVGHFLALWRLQHPSQRYGSLDEMGDSAVDHGSTENGEAALPPQEAGLCATCDNRNTCTFPKPPGGVWHCEEFA